MTAKVGSNPSYIWRSIMEAQVLLKKGAVRRVGSGSTVDILNDPWLPHSTDPYVHTKHPALNGSKVDALLIPGQNEWDEDLVKDIFVERDARLILSIPLSGTGNDLWFWNKEKMGLYTVRSAYSAMQGVSDNAAMHNTSMWKQLWNLKVPLKVKHFAWMALSKCLPTKDELVVKRVPVDILCPVCNNNPESVLHVLVMCQFARLSWVKVGFMDEVEDAASFLDWLSIAFQIYRRREVEEIVMVCWSLWKNRNDSLESGWSGVCRSL